MTDWFPDSVLLFKAIKLLRKSKDKNVRKLAKALSLIEATSVGGAGLVNLNSEDYVSGAFDSIDAMENLNLADWKSFRHLYWDYADIGADLPATVASDARKTLENFFSDEENNEQI